MCGSAIQVNTANEAEKLLFVEMLLLQYRHHFHFSYIVHDFYCANQPFINAWGHLRCTHDVEHLFVVSSGRTLQTLEGVEVLRKRSLFDHKAISLEHICLGLIACVLEFCVCVCVCAK